MEEALLSTLPPRSRHDLLAQAGMRPFTAHTVRDVAQLDHELEHHQAGGPFVEEGQYRGMVSCAVVLTPTGVDDDPLLAVAMSATSTTFARRRDEFAGALTVAAGDLAA